jgi:hypothetical protein
MGMEVFAILTYPARVFPVLAGNEYCSTADPVRVVEPIKLNPHEKPGPAVHWQVGDDAVTVRLTVLPAAAAHTELGDTV